MSGSLGNLSRLFSIARLLARHDALFPLEDLGVAPAICRVAKMLSKRSAPGRPGERLAAALSEAGPSFIKLGQALSTRPDLLGEEITEDLALLQDDLPPFSAAEARQAIEQEFQVPLEELFTRFDETPVAAASIAQVHFAETTEGEQVAVKILRPGIETRFRRDLDLFRWCAKIVERARPDLKRLKPREIVETIAQSVELEMDLRFEAAAAAEMADNFEGDATFIVPAVDWARTGARVLTTGRIDGLSINDRDAIIAAGIEPRTVVENAARAFFNQVFRDGFFHADLHPGNLFVMEDGAIGAVDFGIMGRVDQRTRRTLGEMLLGFLTRDYRRAAEVHFEAGWVPRDKSVDAFTQACRSIAEPILDKPQHEISVGRLLGQLFQVTETFAMEAQPQLLLLQKTMLTAEGVSRRLYPDTNMWILARPLIEDWMLANLGPEAKIAETMQGLAQAAERLPRVMEDLEIGARRLAEGRLTLDPETVRLLRDGDGKSRTPVVLWIGVALLAAIFLFALVD
ncbi:MAG: 2-polyprenylphenol 6-hydroxylase [Rhodospirillaceae bacterium]|nr:2-polyprenylphenol 6-hydroxylase [Rhodospirillaceae bacterium]